MLDAINPMLQRRNKVFLFILLIIFFFFFEYGVIFWLSALKRVSVFAFLVLK